MFYLVIAGLVGVAYMAFEVYSCTTDRVVGHTPVLVLFLYTLTLFALLILFGAELLQSFLHG